MFQVIFLQVLPSGDMMGSEGGLMSMLPFLAMILVLYFFMIRPQMSRQKKEKTFQSEIGKGKNIVTSSGIHAEKGIDEDMMLAR